VSNPSFKNLHAYLNDMQMIALTLLLRSSTFPKAFCEKLVLQEDAADLLRSSPATRRMSVTVQPMVTSILAMPGFQLCEKLGSLLALRRLELATVANHLLPNLSALVGGAAAQVADSDVERVTAAVALHRACVKSAGLPLHADACKIPALAFLPGSACSRDRSHNHPESGG
jgi:hypothetical protein